MKIKAVVFDEGDLLYDASFWRKRIYGKFRLMGYKGTFFEMVELWERELVAVYKGKKKYDQAFMDFLRSLGFSGKQLHSIFRHSEKLRKEAPKKRRLFAGEKQALAGMKKIGLKTVILSDSELPEAKHREILADLGICEFFDEILCSCETGLVKPQKKAFFAALKAAGAKPGEALFVGHDSDELEGAKKAGIRTIAFNGLLYSKTRPKADFEAKKFSDILKIAKKIC